MALQTNKLAQSPMGLAALQSGLPGAPGLPGFNVSPTGQPYKNATAVTSEQQQWNPVNLLTQGEKPRTGAGEFFLGKQEGLFQLPTQTPQAMNILAQLLSGGLERLQQPGAGFEPIGQKARTSFFTKTVPSLAERFTALGTGGSQRSSAFQGALGQAGAGLEENLAALQSMYELQNRSSALDQLRLGFQPQFENIFRPGTEGALQQVGRGTGGFLGKLLSLFI